MWLRSVALSVAASALLCASRGVGAATAPAGAVAYVSNSGSNSVSVVDLADMSEVLRVGVGEEPMRPSATPDGALVFVPNRRGSDFDETPTASKGGGKVLVRRPSVSVIDTATNTVIATIRLSGGGPANCVVTPDGAKLYVACAATASVSVVDVASRTEIVAIDLPSESAWPEGIAVTPDGAKVYVVNSQDASVNVISTATDSVVGPTIGVGANPRDAAVTADGSKVLVVGDGPPVVILTATDTVSPTVLDDLGSQQDVAISGSTAYVTNQYFSPMVTVKGGTKALPSPGGGSLDVYDLTDGSWVTSIALYGPVPVAVDLLADGSVAFVTDDEISALAGVDLAAESETGERADVGSRPFGVVVVQPQAIVDSFFLPKKVAYRRNAAAPAQSVLRASGFFDTGSRDVDLTAAATLSVGGVDFHIPSLSASPDARTFTYEDGGLRFVVVKNPFGSSRAKFRLQYVGDLGASVPTDGTVLLRFRNDAVDGLCEVRLQDGGFRLGRKRGALSQPNLFVVRSHAFLRGGGRDSLAIIVGLATNGSTPDAADEVRVRFGSVLAATIPAASFERSGDAYVFRGDIGGVTGVTLDYVRESVTIVGRNLDLGDFPVGPSPLTILVGIGADDRGVAVRVSRRGNLLKY